MPSKQNKKITALMFTELADYAENVKHDKNLALQILEEHNKILSSIINDFSGKIIKYINETIFADFSSATNAINTAVEIQKKLKKINEENPEDFQINVKIGVHMAEVYEEGGDLFGDGVNLAARIKSVAFSTEILTSQSVYNSIRSEKEIFVRDLGRVELKNIEDPERIFKIYLNKTHYKSETLDIAINNMAKRGVMFFDYKKKSKEKVISVAVQYINNLGTKDDEFFCYGLTDDLITTLTNINQISIPSIKESLKLKEVSEPLAFGSELNVEYIIYGSLMKMGDQFRVSVELHNVVNSKLIWKDQWEDSVQNLSNVINKITLKTIESFGISIPESLEKHIAEKQTVKPEAYELRLKARFAYQKAKNNTDLEIVKGLLQQAFDVQPNYIEARNFYADILIKLGQLDQAIDSLEESLNIAKKEKDQLGLCTLYKSYGNLYKNWGKYFKAISYLNKGLKLAAQLENLKEEAYILNSLGQCYLNSSELDNAIDCLKRSIQIKKDLGNTIGLATSLGNLSLAYREIGDYSKAISLKKEFIDILKSNNMNFHLGRGLMNYANLLVYIGNYKEARSHYMESMELCKQFEDIGSIGLIYRNLGLVEMNLNNYDKAIEFLKKAIQMHKKAKHLIAIEPTTLFLGQAYLHKNDLDKALELVEKAVLLTDRRRHTNQAQNLDEYWTLPSRCVKLLILTKKKKSKVDEIDEIYNEINTLHVDQHKARELWWLAQAYFIIGKKKRALESQALAQKELQRKADKIQDNKIKNDYLKNPILHQEMFMDISKVLKAYEQGISLHKSQTTIADKIEEIKTSAFKFCPSCGFNNEKQFKFCPSCGNSLTQ